MRIINFNLPKKYFEKDKNIKLGARLAKFDLKKGDIIRFYEIDEKGNPTGKSYDRKVKDVHKMKKATKFWSKKDLTKYGIYIFNLEIPKKKK